MPPAEFGVLSDARHLQQHLVEGVVLASGLRIDLGARDSVGGSADVRLDRLADGLKPLAEDGDLFEGAWRLTGRRRTGLRRRRIRLIRRVGHRQARAAQHRSESEKCQMSGA